MTEEKPWIADPIELEQFEADFRDALAKDVAALPRPKRKVSYNQSAVLCPLCKKRIRLNNNGHIRIHVSGKVGSEKCGASNADAGFLWAFKDKVVAGERITMMGEYTLSHEHRPSIFSETE